MQTKLSYNSNIELYSFRVMLNQLLHITEHLCTTEGKANQYDQLNLIVEFTLHGRVRC